MSYTILISGAELDEQRNATDWVIVDCRFDLANTGWGREQYFQSHIPGARYAHLDEDLSGPVIRGRTGRHPLPDVATFEQQLSAWGIGHGTQVVAYDQGGGMFAARLWWMLRWMGHERVAVLDGGWAKWQREGRPVSDLIPDVQTQRFLPTVNRALEADVDEVVACRNDAVCCLLDARGGDRFRGENETLDPVAGHIPGALSAPFLGNLGLDGCFLDQALLRERYLGLLGDRRPADAIVYCGSGVTAAHSVLAMMHAGLDAPRLYVGSWSHWITDPSRPVAVGKE